MLPPQLEQLLACRAMANTSERLACYDQQSAAVSAAISTRDIVVLSRERTRETRRSSFGLEDADLARIVGGDEDELREIESTVTAVGRNPEGGWIVGLADGSTWSQTDYTPIAIAPEEGQKAVVRRGSFGAFFLRLAGQPGVRVQRVR